MAGEERIEAQSHGSPGPQGTALGSDLDTEQQAPAALVSVPQPDNRRWDRLSDEERRQRSCEVALRELHSQQLPLIASAAQHQRISAILAAAVSVDTADQYSTPSEKAATGRRDNKNS
jgi:hypothetical protein